jgi:hypothetical protein
MPARFDFVCRHCKAVFEETVEREVRITLCSCGAVADRKFSPNAQIRIPEGFKQATRSDFTVAKGRHGQKAVWPSARLKK